MDWKARIKEYRKVETKHERAKAKADEAKRELSQAQASLLIDIETVKEAAGEDPFIVVAGRQIGVDYKDAWKLADNVKAVEIIVAAQALDLLKPSVGDVRTAIDTGSLEEAAAKKLSRLLINTPVKYLADRKAK